MAKGEIGVIEPRPDSHRPLLVACGAEPQIEAFVSSVACSRA